jgi:hypothetical protein
VSGYCEHGNETFDPIKGKEFLGQLSDISLQELLPPIDLVSKLVIQSVSYAVVRL